MGAVCIPSLGISRTTRNPGVSRSTRNAVMPRMPLDGSVLAKQRNRSAIGPAVIQVLRPFRTQPSPWRSARVCHAEDSEPASGSLAALAPSSRPSHRPGRYAPLLGLGAEREDRHRDRPERGVDREDQARVGAAVAQALHRRDGRRQVLAPAAIFGRHRQPGHAEPGTARIPSRQNAHVRRASSESGSISSLRANRTAASCQCC